MPRPLEVGADKTHKYPKKELKAGRFVGSSAPVWAETRSYSIDLKNRAISMYTKGLLGGSFRSIAAALDIGKSTLHRWITYHPATRHADKTCQQLHDIRQHVAAFLDANPFAIAVDVRSHILRQCEIRLSIRTVNRYIHQAGFTRKRPSISIHGAPDREREVFSQHIRSAGIQPKDIISIDESSICLNTLKLKGYARKGQALRRQRPVRRRVRMTLLMAVGVDGILGWRLWEGSCNRHIFGDFVRELDTRGKKYLLMDNVRFHHSKETLAATAASLEARGLASCSGAAASRCVEHTLLYDFFLGVFINLRY
jgi:transposase-like protein